MSGIDTGRARVAPILARKPDSDIEYAVAIGSYSEQGWTFERKHTSQLNSSMYKPESTERLAFGLLHVRLAGVEGQ